MRLDAPAAFDRANRRRAVLAVAGLLLVALATVAATWSRDMPPWRWTWALGREAQGHDAAALLFGATALPRSAMAALVGAALATAGVLTQAALGNNPLAVPSALGVTTGAQLGVLLATVAASSAWAPGREVAALLGATLSLAVVMAAGAATRFSAIALVLAGLSVSLFCAAAASLLALLNHEAVGAAAIWGAGSLAQDGWGRAATLAPELAILLAGAAMLVRPAAVLGLSDHAARALGASPTAVRVGLLAIAVALTGAATAAVGIVGFVDLATPLLLRLLGARRLALRLVLAPVAGAGLLLILDSGVQALEAATGTFLPTGALAGALAAPLLLALLPKLRSVSMDPAAPVVGGERLLRTPATVLLALLLATTLIAASALLIGRTADGWAVVDTMDAARILLPWRWPRAAMAFAGGGALAVAGALLQRGFNNPLAGPESLGLGAAALVGAAVALTVDPAAGRAALLLAGTGGTLMLGAALLGTSLLGTSLLGTSLLGTSLLGTSPLGTSLLGTSLRARFSPDHVLLTGVALNAALGAVVTALLAFNDGRAAVLSAMMGGSTAAATAPLAGLALAGLAAALPLALLLARPLDLLGLGEPVARATGLRLGRIRLLVLLLAAILTAGATLLVGPLSFAGLLGPHVASRLGLRGAVAQLPGAALAGGLVMLLADGVGRLADAPFELPAGLVASLVGLPVLMILLARRARKA